MRAQYLPLYLDDFDGATPHLSAESEGFYMRLLKLCWRTPGCSIPNEPAWIAPRIRADLDTFERVVRPLLAEFFVCSNARFCQLRLRREYEKLNVANARRVAAGKRGGAAKAAKTQESVPSNALALHNHIHKQESSLRSDSVRASPASPDVDLFAAFATEIVAEQQAKGDAALSVLDRLDRGDAAASVSGPERRSLTILAQGVFDAMAVAAQARLRNGARSIHYVLRKARESGADADRIAAECVAYYAAPEQQDDDGRFTKNLYWLVDDGHWADWRDLCWTGDSGGPKPEPDTVAISDPSGPLIVLHGGIGYAAPLGQRAVPSGDIRDPDIHRQLLWLEEWFSRSPDRRGSFWREHERGPQPGKTGSRVWPSVLEKDPRWIAEQEAPRRQG